LVAIGETSTKLVSRWFRSRPASGWLCLSAIPVAMHFASARGSCRIARGVGRGAGSPFDRKPAGDGETIDDPGVTTSRIGRPLSLWPSPWPAHPAVSAPIPRC